MPLSGLFPLRDIDGWIPLSSLFNLIGPYFQLRVLVGIYLLLQ